jgi:hypothetical protein
MKATKVSVKLGTAKESVLLQGTDRVILTQVKKLANSEELSADANTTLEGSLEQCADIVCDLEHLHEAKQREQEGRSDEQDEADDGHKEFALAWALFSNSDESVAVCLRLSGISGGRWIGPLLYGGHSVHESWGRRHA